jgi:hypothetical protein
MTEREKLQRDIDTLRESIRLNWLDLSRLPLNFQEAQAIRAEINVCVRDLADLLMRLDQLKNEAATQT